MKTDLKIIFSLFASASRLQRKRAYLTIAAIAWGTVAILLLLAFGEGLKRQMDKNRRSTGENLAVMWPGETTKPWKGLPPGRPIRPRVEDVEFIRARMPELKSAHGELVSWRTAIAYAFGVRIMTPSITAWPPTIRSLSGVLIVFDSR